MDLVDTGLVFVDAGFADAGLVVDLVVAVLDTVLLAGAADLVDTVLAFALDAVAGFAGTDLAGLAAAVLAFSTFFASPETAF